MLTRASIHASRWSSEAHKAVAQIAEEARLENH
jgi:hypothetical protein